MINQFSKTFIILIKPHSISILKSKLPIFQTGIPLEMSQMGWTGMLRVAGLYFAGVGMGCLGASVAEPKKYLLGASAGVYALIFAHLGKEIN